jgi:hypothetical protein
MLIQWVRFGRTGLDRNRWVFTGLSPQAFEHAAEMIFIRVLTAALAPIQAG